eukprot:2200841-Prymnesium_polylepis.1
MSALCLTPLTPARALAHHAQPRAAARLPGHMSALCLTPLTPARAPQPGFLINSRVAAISCAYPRDGGTTQKTCGPDFDPETASWWRGQGPDLRSQHFRCACHAPRARRMRAERHTWRWRWRWRWKWKWTWTWTWTCHGHGHVMDMDMDICGSCGGSCGGGEMSVLRCHIECRADRERARTGGSELAGVFALSPPPVCLCPRHTTPRA